MRVSFGLVSVPVKLYSATESHDVSFRQVHAKDGGRIKYQRVCSIDGEEVAYADIAKGYETEDGEMVILTDDDLAELPSTSSREIAVEKFVPSDQIDPMLFEKSYYLEPEKSGAKPYALLRQALLDADRMAVVTVALRQRTSIAVLRVRDDVIVLQTMMWPDEIRMPDFYVEAGDVKPAEVKMANMLVETLAGDFDAGRVRGRLRRGPSRRWSRPRSRAARSSAPPPRPSPPARSSTCSRPCSARSTPRRAAARAAPRPEEGSGEGDGAAEAPEEKPARKSSAPPGRPPRRRPPPRRPPRRLPRRRPPAKKSATRKTPAKKAS